MRNAGFLSSQAQISIISSCELRWTLRENCWGRNYFTVLSQDELEAGLEQLTSPKCKLYAQNPDLISRPGLMQDWKDTPAPVMYSPGEPKPYYKPYL